MADEKLLRERNTKEVVNALLDDYEKITRQLFESLSSVSLYRTTKTEATSSDTTKIIEKLTEKDKELQAAVRVAKEQQQRQQEIHSIKDDISRKDQKILHLEVQLKEAEHILSQALFQAKKKLGAIHQAKQGCVSSEDLIKYAHRISSSSAVEAPTTWMPGDPRRPYPLDIEMRSGLLGRFSEGVPMGTEVQATSRGFTDIAASTTVGSSANGMADGIANGQSAASLSWQSNLHAIGIATAMEHQSGSNDMTTGAANGRQEHGVTTEEVEFMSSSSCSSSSDSP